MIEYLYRCLRNTSQRGFVFFLAVFILSGCSTQDGGDLGETQVTPTLPVRSDLQVPGLVQLVDSEKNPPPMDSEPSQADLGSQVYYQICMACHGDWGQGLTDEWRETWGDDMNCWQSKCHAANHPPWGFAIPKSMPPLLGMGSLARFQTADELHDSIATTMPWWNPGSLTEDQSWQVTTYLMRERGEITDAVTLDVSNVGIFRLHTQTTLPDDDLPGIILLLVVLSATLLSLVWVFNVERGNRNKGDGAKPHVQGSAQSTQTQRTGE